MKAATGATPLRALEAVAFDSETTGLDPKKDRIVQIGAVGISRGHVRPEETFVTLVNPRMPIPPASTRFHRITDAMTHDAPDFADALGKLQAFRRERVVIGYALGFDFAIIAAECARRKMDWQKPRSLCVRVLSTLVNPTLPDHSLETIASWLGVEIGARHSALGDACTAADIFSALVPHLEKTNIRTLAEAERASLGNGEQMARHSRAGWATPVSTPKENTALAQVDPYAYRHRVTDVMSRPVSVLRDGQPAGDAIAVMAGRRISSVLVSKSGAADGDLAEYGIVTERDVMRRIASDGPAFLERPLREIAVAPLVSIADEAFVYRAMGRMERHNIRHLAVRDSHNRLLGVISARDLLRLRGGAAIRLDDAIEAAASPAEMAQAWAMLPDVANRLVSEEVDARLVAGVVSEELRIMTRRAAQLAEAAMKADGRGGPPCDYALLVLGSGGRGESLLAADQDNAIVFAGDDAAGTNDRWFAELGERIATALDSAGIACCKGGVMAKNPPWRGLPETWHRRVRHWVARSEPDDLLNVDIFFDMRGVHGSAALAARVYDDALDQAHAHQPFAKLLGDRLGDFGSAFGMFGRIKALDGRIDLKKYGLFPIVSCARALAIRHDVRHRQTRLRLEGLIARGIGHDEGLRALLDAHVFLLTVLLAQQSRDLSEGVPVSNNVAINALSPTRQARLKLALRTVESVPYLFRTLVTARAPQ